MKKPKIQIILGTTREGRMSESIGRWFKDYADRRGDIEAELVDLAEWDLPFFSAPMSPIRGRYDETQRGWADKIAQADGYVIVTAEYNHGYPAVLKNALDMIYAEWGYKPMAFVGYGVTGATRAVEQLREVAVELNAVPTRNAVAIMAPWEHMTQNGDFDGKHQEAAAQRTLDQLVWWAEALMPAREQQLQRAA